MTNRLYVHVLSWPFRDLHLPGLVGKVKYVQFLHDGSELRFTEKSESCGVKATPDDALTIQIPVIQPDTLVPVIEVILK